VWKCEQSHTAVQDGGVLSPNTRLVCCVCGAHQVSSSPLQSLRVHHSGSMLGCGAANGNVTLIGMDAGLSVAHRGEQDRTGQLLHALGSVSRSTGQPTSWQQGHNETKSSSGATRTQWSLGELASASQCDDTMERAHADAVALLRRSLAETPAPST